MNVFDRTVQTALLQTKKPQEVWEEFEKIIDKMGKPSRLDLDDGVEWSGPFAENAQRKGIAIQTKPDGDINFLSVNDAAMKSVKETMFRMMAKEETTSWINFLEPATSAYQKTPHGTLHGESPEDVKDEAVVRFRLEQDNAEKLKRNANQMQQRQARIRAAGAFRPMLPRSEWERSFKPKFSGKPLEVDKIEGGFVFNNRKRYALGRVQPAALNQKKNIPAALAKGSERRQEKAAQEMKEFVAPLKAYLRGGGGKNPAAVGRHMNERFGFQEKLKELRLGSVTAFARLYPEDFQITSDGQIQLRNTRPTIGIRLR